MKKFFLDCGTHLGQGLTEISSILSIDESWEVHSWEANPYTFEKFDKSKYPNFYHFYNVAISDNNNTVTLNIESINNNDCGQGTSIIEKNLWMNPMHKGSFIKETTVPCLDLSEWIKKNCKLDDLLIIKLDIEGAEYMVLEKMINDKTIDLVDHIFIEWHARFFPNKEIYYDKQNKIISILKEKNIKITRWK